MASNVVASLRRSEYHRLIAMLREARERAGVSQSELARRVDIPQPRLFVIENGTRRLDAIELIDLLRALDVDVAEFMVRLDAETRPGT